MRFLIECFSILLLLFAFTITVNAENADIYVDLNSLQYSTDENNYQNITEYETLDDFLVDYNSNSLPSIYITDFLYDGVSTVKTPDLDDFIEEDSNDVKIKTLSIKVININTTGNIQFSGEIKGAMIGVNTNNGIIIEKKGQMNWTMNMII